MQNLEAAARVQYYIDNVFELYDMKFDELDVDSYIWALKTAKLALISPRYRDNAPLETLWTITEMFSKWSVCSKPDKTESFAQAATAIRDLIEWLLTDF